MTEFNWSLGYWLVAGDAESTHVGPRSYHGLDRRPLFPGPDDDARLQQEGRTSLVKLRERFWDLEDSALLHRDPNVALGMRDDLAPEGYTLHVVHADVVAPRLTDIPTDLRDRYERSVDRWSIDVLPTAGSIKHLGIDVTFPFPTFHSAIRQPVLSRVAPETLARLNNYGLFTDHGAANRAATAVNRVNTSWRPFCSVEIALVGDADSDR